MRTADPDQTGDDANAPFASLTATFALPAPPQTPQSATWILLWPPRKATTRKSRQSRRKVGFEALPRLPQKRGRAGRRQHGF